ncbi:unnamed protein product [Owenia fusiformis]|uniref:Uncharacterized protein n=1 Tax=Owenia fusiformis TaxID=6347 RepID=A0A8J1Y6M8_OWEFU|nr:unnamed protein product [Owenia fusiformis]
MENDTYDYDYGYEDHQKILRELYEDLEANELYQTGERIWIYVPPILIILGTLGNTCSILVLSRKRMRTNTTSLFLIALAIVDTLVLWTGLLRYWIRSLISVDVRNISSAGCKVHMFLVYTLTHLSSWFLVMVAIERLIAVYFPHKVKLLCTRMTFLMSMLTVILTIFALNMHFFWAVDLVEIKPEHSECSEINMAHFEFNQGPWSWIDAMVASLVPFVIMLVSNCLIICKVVLWRIKKTNASHPKVTSMTAILVLCNFVFIVCTLPIVIFLMSKDVWYPNVFPLDPLYPKYNLGWAIVNMFQYTNHAINFLLYCLAGPKFRRELVSIFRELKCFKKCLHNTVAPENVDSITLQTQHSQVN